MKHLEISYKTSAGGGKLTLDSDSGEPIMQKTFALSSGSSGGAIENRDEIIKVTISLDGKIENIELTNKT